MAKMNLEELSEKFQIESQLDYGFDVLSIFSDSCLLSGYITPSPFANVINEKYGISIEDESQKTFRARWIIEYNKLSIMRVDGKLKGMEIDVYDLFSTFNHYEVMNKYPKYSGSLKFTIQEVAGRNNNWEALLQNSNTVNLILENGILINKELFTLF